MSSFREISREEFADEIMEAYYPDYESDLDPTTEKLVEWNIPDPGGGLPVSRCRSSYLGRPVTSPNNLSVLGITEDPYAGWVNGYDS